MKFDKDQKTAKLYLFFLIGITLLWLLYTVAGFWILPSLLKSQLEVKLSERLHRTVSIQSIELNPYELSFSIKGFAVRELNSTDNFLSFDELSGVVQGGSIVAGALIMRELQLTRPFINIALGKDYQLNFSDLLTENKDAAPANPPAPQAPPPAALEDKEMKPAAFRLSVRNIEIIDGGLDFVDGYRDTKESIRNFDLNLPLITSLGDSGNGWTELTVTADINQSPLSMMVRAKPFSEPLESVVELHIRSLRLLDYQAYFPPQLRFKLISGLLDVSARLAYSLAEGNPALKITGEAAFTDLEAVDPNQKRLVSLPKTELSLSSFEPFARKLQLSRVSVSSPEVHLWRNKDGKLNAETLIAETVGGKAQTPGKEQEPGFLVEVESIEMGGGKIEFTDYSLNREFYTSLDALEVNLTKFSTAPDTRTAMKLSGRTEAREEFDLNGSLSFDPFRFQGSVTVSGIALAKYAPYYSGGILFDVIDGQLGLKSLLHLKAEGGNPDVRLSDMTVTLGSLKLKKRDEGSNFLEIPSLQVRESSLNLLEKAITLGEIISEKATIATVREKNGELNLQTLFHADPDQATGENPPSGRSETGQSPWKLMLQRIALKDYQVRFEDRMPPEPVIFSIDRINVDARNISPEQDTRSRISLSSRINQGGEVSIDGDLGINPLFSDVRLSLKDVSILPVQQYLPDDLKVKPTAGRLSASGNLLLGKQADDALNAFYTGELSLSDFSSVDKIKGEDFFFCRTLALNGIDAGTNPLRANVKKISVKDFFSRVTISPDGKVNILQVLGSETESRFESGDNRKRDSQPAKQIAGKPDQPAKQAGNPSPKTPVTNPEKKAGPSPVIKIDQVVLQGGEIAFSDSHIKPNFRAELLDVGGTITGLSTVKNMLADVNLRGKLYRSSPLEITGKINPFPENLNVDLSVKFKNIDLTRWNPYAQKYVGYTLEKGNLHLELKYVVVKRTLDSQNNIVLDRLTLGEKVDSPDATTLPVKFAVSLLQDRNGEIALGIPVTGNLDDPNFSLGTVVLNVLKNLIMKAVTAPFALLGALLPQGVEEIDRVEIDRVSGKISESDMKKLDAVTRILHDRPNLELDLQTQLDSETAREILKQKLFLTKLKNQKMKEMIGSGAVVVSVDQVTLRPDEIQKYLRLAYEEDFPKGGFFKWDFGKKPSPEEMQSQIMTKIQVSDDDLQSLAYDWALAVKEYLLEGGKVEARRLFVLEPTIVNPASKAEFKGNGVYLKLK